MTTAATSGASAQLASVMSSAASRESRLALAEAQINASAVAGGSAPPVSPGAQAPGRLQVFA